MFVLIVVATSVALSHHVDYSSCKAEIHKFYEDRLNPLHDSAIERQVSDEVASQKELMCLHVFTEGHHHHHRNNN